MSEVSVSQAAERLGVNVQRVHQRIADGSLPARRVGHQWVMSSADLARLDRIGPGRPLSNRAAWLLLECADPVGVEIVGSPSERSRARARFRDLLAQAVELPVEASAARLRALLRNRAERMMVVASGRDLDALREDSRIVLSGVSSPQSGMASRDLVEGYVGAEHQEDVVRDFLLVEGSHSDANVVLHVVANDMAVPELADHRLLLAADLAEHHRPRESARTGEILSDLASEAAT